MCYNVPDVIYIPINPDNEEVMRDRKRLLKEMVDDGWIHIGSSKLLDETDGRHITVLILVRSCSD